MNYEDKQVVTKGLQLVTMPWRTSFQQKKIMALDSVERFACKLRQKKYWLVAVMNFMGILFSPLGTSFVAKALEPSKHWGPQAPILAFRVFRWKETFSKMIFRKKSWNKLFWNSLPLRKIQVFYDGAELLVMTYYILHLTLNIFCSKTAEALIDLELKTSEIFAKVNRKTFCF